MNIFNIIGPVMIGPSSSHTAGACRIGRVVNKLAGDARIVRVRIQLSGSFARTYQGHGTDRAILAGILGYYSWSEELRDSMRIAAERGLSYEFVPEDIPGTHPNTARVYYECDNGKQGMVEGASIGGGNIQIRVGSISTPTIEPSLRSMASHSRCPERGIAMITALWSRSLVG